MCVHVTKLSRLRYALSCFYCAPSERGGKRKTFFISIISHWLSSCSLVCRFEWNFKKGFLRPVLIPRSYKTPSEKPHTHYKWAKVLNLTVESKTPFRFFFLSGALCTFKRHEMSSTEEGGGEQGKFRTESPTHNTSAWLTGSPVLPNNMESVSGQAGAARCETFFKLTGSFGRWWRWWNIQNTSKLASDVWFRCRSEGSFFYGESTVSCWSCPLLVLLSVAGLWES